MNKLETFMALRISNILNPEEYIFIRSFKDVQKQMQMTNKCYHTVTVLEVPCVKTAK
jgi:hypothetical protein